MHKSIRYALVLFLQLAWLLPSSEVYAANGADSYRAVELVEFIEKNQLSEEFARKKLRLMLPPESIQFEAMLMREPQAGDFSLVYDTLNMWQITDNGKPLEVSHSAFVGATDGQVISVYVEKKAAVQLRTIYANNHNQPTATRFYAVRLYNYEKGPRLLIIEADSALSPE